jgi:uncharacterized repeat protein (TIGR01451 family)
LHLRKDLLLKRLFLFLVAALALLAPVVGQAASGPVLNFYAPNTTTPAITNFGYGPVLPGQSVSKTFTLQNTGGSATAALKISLTTTAGATDAFTKTGDTCSQPVPISLGKGKTCQITIRFTPVAGGESDAADLTAVSKKPNASKTLHLTGSGRVDSDLSLDLTRTLTSDLDGNGQNSIGDRVTFTLTLHNAGPDAASSVHVTDLLPAGYLFFVASASQGTYNSATGDWNVGTVSVSSTPVVSIVTTLRGGKPVSAYTNDAQVFASGSFDPDSTPGNNSTTEDDDASVTPPIADLSVTNAVALASGGDLDGSGSLTVGDQVVFTLTVSNAGPDSAPLVRLLDWLGEGTQYYQGFTYVGDDGLGTYDPVTGVWDVGDMAPGTTQTLHVTTTVTPITGNYVNTVQVWSFGFAEPYPGSERNEYFDPDSTANNNVPGEDDQATVTPVVVELPPVTSQALCESYDGTFDGYDGFLLWTCSDFVDGLGRGDNLFDSCASDGGTTVSFSAGSSPGEFTAECY